MGSSLTWEMQGDASVNKIHVSQNAADSNSPLNCSPDCPQKDQDEGEEEGHGGRQPQVKSKTRQKTSKPRTPTQRLQNTKNKRGGRRPSKIRASSSKRKTNSKKNGSRGKSPVLNFAQVSL